METQTDEDLEAIRRRCADASPGPWRAMIEGRDHVSGDSFIMLSEGSDRRDMYLTIDGAPATASDLDFIASAKQDVLQLIAEVVRTRGASS